MTDKRILTIPLSDLGDEGRRIVDRMIAEGRHRSAQEVIDEALRRLMAERAGEALTRAINALGHGDYRRATIPPEGERR